MRLDVVTIFPEYLEPLRHALLGKAIEQGIVSIGVHDLRQWATDRHKSVDDSPFGGGPGMVMKPAVWAAALNSIAEGHLAEHALDSAQVHLDKARHDEVNEVVATGYGVARDVRPGEDAAAPLLLVPTPAGKPFTQADAQAWSGEEHIVFACGRYEGIDQRVFFDAQRRYRVREVSIGDYVLVGGEVATLVMTEAIVRLIPGVLGNSKSHEEDSFSAGLLEGYSFTKPREWEGMDVPEVLTSGNHGAIEEWRHTQALARTARVRPDLVAREMKGQALTTVERTFVQQYRRVSVHLNILLDRPTWEELRPLLPYEAYRRGVDALEVQAEEINLTCEPDNMVVNQYAVENGRPPITEVLYRVVARGWSALPLAGVTKAVIAGCGRGTHWYGSAVEGWDYLGETAQCAWNG